MQGVRNNGVRSSVGLQCMTHVHRHHHAACFKLHLCHVCAMCRLRCVLVWCAVPAC